MVSSEYDECHIGHWYNWHEEEADKGSKAGLGATRDGGQHCA